MSHLLHELLRKMTPDPWREEHGFSTELREANDKLFAAGSELECQQHIAAWLQEHQPCLFGRIAAQRGLIAYCIISEADLARGDEYVQGKIQAARLQWSADAFDGRRSGFVIAVVHEGLATATPDETMGEFARNLCSMYLLENVGYDAIHLDKLRFEAPLSGRPTWEWDVGVNYFSAHGDCRWWHDHRIPGGIAFSMNSVGHMVKSVAAAQALEPLAKKLGLPDVDLADGKVDDLGKALKLAMMTIDRAANARSGKATWLLPIFEPV